MVTESLCLLLRVSATFIIKAELQLLQSIIYPGGGEALPSLSPLLVIAHCNYTWHIESFRILYWSPRVGDIWH